MKVTRGIAARIFSVVLALVCLPWNMVGYAVSVEEPVLDPDTRIMVISGRTKSRSKEKVSVAVYNPGFNEKNALAADFTDAFVYVNQKYSEEDGSFSFSFELSDSAKIGNMEIRVGNGSSELPFSLDVYYISDTELQGLMKQLLKLSEAEAVEQLLSAPEVLAAMGLDRYFYDLITGSRSCVYEELARLEEDNTHNDVKNTFLEASFKAVFEENAASATLPSFTVECCEKGYTELLFRDKAFYELFAEYDSAVFLSLNNKAQAAEFSDVEEIRSFMSEFVVCTELSYMRTGDVGDKLTRFSELGIISVDLSLLSNTDEAAVFKRLTGIGFESVQEVEEAYAEAVRAEKRSTSSASSGGTSGGLYVAEQPRPAEGIQTLPVTEKKEENEEAFSDLDEAPWAREAIEYMAEVKVISGFEDGTFKPSKQLRKEEYIQMLVRALGLEADETAPKPEFLDVPYDAWYREALYAAYTNGIVKGISETQFGTGAVVSRQDAAVMLWRASGREGTKENPADLFDDDSEISGYARDAVYILRDRGLISGVGDNSFAPKRGLSRAEGAMLLYRFYTSDIMTEPDDAAEGSDFSDETVRVLCELGIMDTGYLKADTREAMTRAEFSKLITDAVYPGLNKSFAGDIPDVESGSEYAQYIYAACEKGLMSVDEDGLFRPEEEIEYEFAVKAAVDICGYTEKAVREGGYPYGYISVARSEDILDDTDSTNSIYNISQILLNALCTPLNMKEYMSDGSYSFVQEDNTTLLSRTRNIFVNDGVVVQSGYISTEAGTSLEADKVKIGRDVLVNPSKSYDNYLGLDVRYFYFAEEAEAEDKELVTVQSRKNQIKRIDISDVEYFEGKTLAYHDKSKNDRLVRVNIDYDTDISYNGRADTDISDTAWLSGEGTLLLIDNGSDGDYDCMMITAYEDSYWLKTYDEYENTMFDIYGAQIRLDDYEAVVLRKNYENIGFEELKLYDVVSVAASRDKEVAIIDVSDTKLSGTVRSKSDEDGYEIDSEFYQLASRYITQRDLGNSYAHNIELNSRGVFCLDVLGRIVGINAEGDGLLYGYMISFRGSDAEEGCRSSIFTSAGMMQEIEYADKVSVNGENRIEAAALYENRSSFGLDTRRLIRYMLDDEGKIKRIDVAGKKAADNDDSFTEDYAFGGRIWRSNGRSFEGEFGVKASTLVFSVPYDDNDVRNENWYSMKTYQGLLPDTNYTVAAYNTDRLNVAEAIVIKEKRPTVAPFDMRPMIVDKVTRTVNEDNEPCYKISGIYQAKRYELLTQYPGVAEEEAIFNGDNIANPAYPTGVGAGDIIKFATDSKGRAVIINKYFDASLDEGKKTGNRTEYNGVYYGKFSCFYGSYLGCENDMARFKNNKVDYVHYMPTNTPVYMYDTQNNVLMIKSLAWLNQIAGEDCTVFAVTRYARATDIIVYR